MRASVVTPSFNMAGYLASTIESVLINLRPGDEYFIVDGGSTDGSVDVIKRYANRLTGWVSEPDRGYADAIAKGFVRTTGDMQCWINTGDLLLAGALDTAREALEATRSDMIFGDDFYIDETGRVISFSRGYIRDLRAAMLYGGWTPLQDACFWRRSLYERVGGIDCSLRYAADYDLFLRFVMSGTVSYVPKAFSAFRRHAGQKSISGSEAYKQERKLSRQRQFARCGLSPRRRAWRSVWHSAAIRWRIHVAQRAWTRPDLHGTPVNVLRCQSYWPPSLASQ